MKKLLAIFLALMLFPISANAATMPQDVDSGSYYANAVIWSIESGVATGTSDTTFSPDVQCTRAQVVTFLYRYSGSPAVTASKSFADVAPGSYYYDAVSWAVEKNITVGTSANMFSPDATCTRAQIVTFLYRGFGNNENSADNGYSDVPEYARNAVNWAASHGITSGIGNGLFGSNNPCTRAQAITFLYRYNNLAEGKIPAYSGSPYTVVNNNVPSFTNLTTTSFESYGDLDSLGRCTAAYACIGRDLMPTEERGSIGMIKPTGWHTVRYDGIVDGNYLYNRCHLVGYQLTGENENEKNLITGTRYLNVEGMLPFENMVADYIKETGNHVMYRVTPEFEGNNLLASGVLMEAKSVEDNGAGIQFCVYCYNVQPGITINYATGDSSLTGQTTPTEPVTSSYVLNTRTKKFHLPSCSSVEKMSPNNRKDVTTSRDELISEGYSPCQICKP